MVAAEFRRYSTYRLAMLAGVFTNTVFGFIRISVLLTAIGTAGGVLAGYTLKEASSYVWLGQALLAPIGMFPTSDLADRVKSGDIAVDLARPIDLQLAGWAADLGRAGFVLLARGVLPVLIGAATIGLAVPDSWTVYPLGLLSLVVAVSISFTLRFLLNLLAFWVLDIRGFMGVYFVMIGLLSGFYLPVAFFPAWLQSLAYATPAPAIFQIPIDILAGQRTGLEAVEALIVQVGWLAVVLADRPPGAAPGDIATGGPGWLTRRRRTPPRTASRHWPRTGPCSPPGCAASSATGRASGWTWSTRS